MKKCFIILISSIVLLSFNFQATYAFGKDNKVPVSNSKNIRQLQQLERKINELIISSDTALDSYAKKYFNLAKTTEDEKYIANAYHFNGKAQQFYTNYAQAIEYFLFEKQIRENTHDFIGLAYVNKDLGEVYRCIHDLNTSIKHLNIAKNIFEKYNHKAGLMMTYNRIGAYYAEFDGIPERLKSLDYALKSKEIAEQLKNNDLLVSNYIVLGADYTALKDFSLALKYFQKSIELVGTTHSKADISLIHKAIATMYYIKGDYVTAIKYGKIAYQEAIAYNSIVYNWLSTNILYMSYEKTHQSDSAFKYMAISYDAKNKLYQADKIKIIKAAESKYQNEKLEHEIKVTKERNKVTVLIYSTISFLVILVLILLFIRFSNLNKTHKKLAEQNQIIEEQKQKLSALNATKDKFFSIIAHDLKSPFTNILGFSQLLSESTENLDTADTKTYALLINKAAGNTYKLLQNLLEWANLQTGTRKSNLENLGINEIISICMDLANVQADKKNIRIEFNPEENFIVFADVNMLTSIIRNLVNNAVKFTNVHGKVIIRTVESGDYIEISVEDTGVGIPPEKINKLFDIEKASSTPGTDNEEGTGLGLILCKEFVERQKGRIWVESNLGFGSTFYFTVPKAKE